MVDPDEVPFRSFAEGYGDDPPAAVLTTAQREYFFGEKEFEGGSERAVKRRIRQRIQAALWDLLLLSRAYPEEEMKKIRSDDGEFSLPTKGLAAFLYSLQPEKGPITADFIDGKDPTGRDRRAEWTEGDVSRGITYAIQHREGTDVDVETSITVDRGEHLEELAEGDLSKLSRDQLDALLYTGTIDREEYARANERRLNRKFNR
jgi:hypothetical protein